MKKFKYNDNEFPTIYVVATPIGNLSEISQRALDMLNKVETIYCEDTRVSSKLLSHFNIKDKKLESFYLHNEYDKSIQVIETVKKLQEVVLISDAGYPVISDPGQHLVSLAIENDVNVVVINGPNALLPALINSGFKTIPFTFIGFLPHKSNDATNMLEQYVDYRHTLIMYESVHRYKKTLNIIQQVLGNVNVCISRELTKINEEHIYGTVSELLYADLELRGELVISIDNNTEIEEAEIDDTFIINEVNILIEQNVSRKNAIKDIAKKYGLEKNYVYDLVHRK
ncbi:16S rRNA (cytidine(1402)-2'-O)-methyltransferase [Mycoplasma sp. P36-A1]|uniref:16S rRNA (cytidine(1402)-2'-O)-methyltransferase n=1 Tax=Mycoplasma sp. P36-A1 TaxID=3252900 RepID=UPI003C2BE48E